MPTNNFSTGKDVTIVIQTANGPLQLELTDFDYKPKTSTLESKNLRGKKLHAYIPDGYDLSFKVDRMNSVVDDFWAAFEAIYYAGVNQLAGTIYQTIREANGSISQWQFNGVVIKVDNLGAWAGDKKVEQSLSGMATERVKVA
jgi:hypothetical protein